MFIKVHERLCIIMFNYFKIVGRIKFRKIVSSQIFKSELLYYCNFSSIVANCHSIPLHIGLDHNANYYTSLAMCGQVGSKYQFPLILVSGYPQLSSHPY